MTEKIEKLLEDIKSLLIFQLARSGAKSEDVAVALDCGASTLRKKYKWGKKDG